MPGGGPPADPAPFLEAVRGRFFLELVGGVAVAAGGLGGSAAAGGGRMAEGASPTASDPCAAAPSCSAPPGGAGAAASIPLRSKVVVGSVAAPRRTSKGANSSVVGGNDVSRVDRSIMGLPLALVLGGGTGGRERGVSSGSSTKCSSALWWLIVSCGDGTAADGSSATGEDEAAAGRGVCGKGGAGRVVAEAVLSTVGADITASSGGGVSSGACGAGAQTDPIVGAGGASSSSMLHSSCDWDMD